MEEKEIKYEFPRVVDWMFHLSLEHRATLCVGLFNKQIRPILKRYGLDDDEHIRKYLRAENMSVVYEDIMKIDGMAYLINTLRAMNVDPWRKFRDTTRCDVEADPEDEGFVFVRMPGVDSTDERSKRMREKVLESLTVEGGEIIINKKILEDAAVATPDERQRRAYDAAAKFLSEIRKIGLGNKRISDFFTYDSNRLVVNAKGILGII